MSKEQLLAVITVADKKIHMYNTLVYEALVFEEHSSLALSPLGVHTHQRHQRSLQITWEAHHLYNILAAVPVGNVLKSATGGHFRRTEEVDVASGRCELRDVEQEFGVVLDHAHTPDSLSRLLDTVADLWPADSSLVCYFSNAFSFISSDSYIWFFYLMLAILMC